MIPREAETAGDAWDEVESCRGGESVPPREIEWVHDDLVDLNGNRS